MQSEKGLIFGFFGQNIFFVKERPTMRCRRVAKIVVSSISLQIRYTTIFADVLVPTLYRQRHI